MLPKVSKTKEKVILASSSKIRKQLLEEVGLDFSVINSKVNEDFLKKELQGRPFSEQVTRLASEKASVVSKNNKESFVIGSDNMCTIDNKIFEVKKEKWDRIQYTYDDDQQEVQEEITGSFKQYPMRLAWAITIHKSQGQTFEKVIIDMSQGSFAPGQLYVALSRCISLEGIELLRPIKKSDIIVNNQLIGFQDRLI